MGQPRGGEGDESGERERGTNNNALPKLLQYYKTVNK